MPSNKTPKKSSPVGNDDFGSKSASKGKKKKKKYFRFFFCRDFFF